MEILPLDTSSISLKELGDVIDSGMALIPSLLQELITTKQDEEKAKLLLSLEIFLFTIRRFYASWEEIYGAKSMTKKQEQEGKMMAFNFLKDSSAALFGSSKTSKSLYLQMIDTLDKLAFTSDANKNSSSTAYLGGLKAISVNDLALRCLLALNKFSKFLVEESMEANTGYFTADIFSTINSNIHTLVKKRYESTTLIDYGASLLPRYASSFRKLVLQFEEDATKNNELLKLNEFLLQKLLDLPKELIAGGYIDHLVKDSQLERIAKEQLASYLHGHIPLSYQLLKKLKENPEGMKLLRFHSDPQFQIPDYETILNLFTLTEANSKNANIKDLHGILFYFSLANNFTTSRLMQKKEEEVVSTEDNAKKIVDLVTFYHSTSSLDVRFVYSLLDFFETQINPPLAKALSQSQYMKEIVLEEVFLSKRLFDADSAAIIRLGEETVLWDGIGEDQFLSNYLRIPLLYREYDEGEDPNTSEEEKKKVMKDKESEELKNRFIRLAEIFKKNLEETNQDAVDYILGKGDLLQVEVNSRMIYFQVQVLWEIIWPFLSANESEGHFAHPNLCEKISQKNLNLPQEVADFILKYIQDMRLSELASQSAWNMLTSKFQLKKIKVGSDDFFGAVNIISTISDHALQLFKTLPSQLQNLSRKDVEDFGRLNFIAKKLSNPDVEKDWDQIQSDPRFNVKSIVHSICKLSSVVSHDGFNGNNAPDFPVFKLSAKGPANDTTNLQLRNSLLGLMVQSLIVIGKDTKENILLETLNNFTEIFEVQRQELQKGASFTAPEDPHHIRTKLSLTLQNFTALFMIIWDIMGTSGSRKYEIAVHKTLLTKMLEVMSSLRQYCSNHLVSQKVAVQQEMYHIALDIYIKAVWIIRYLYGILIEDPYDHSLKAFLISKFPSRAEAVEAFKPIHEVISKLFIGLDLNSLLIFGTEKTYFLELVAQLFTIITDAADAVHREKGVFLEGFIQSEPIEDAAMETNISDKEILTLPENSDVKISDKSEFKYHILTTQRTQAEIWDKFFNESYGILLYQLAVFSLQGQQLNQEGDIVKFLFAKHVAKEDFKKHWENINQDVWTIINALISSDLEDQLNKASSSLKTKLPDGHISAPLFHLQVYMKLHDIVEKWISEDERILLGKKPCAEDFLKIRPASFLKKLFGPTLPSDKTLTLYEVIYSKPSHIRYKLLCELYETPCDEFSEEQQNKMDLIYDGLKHVLTNSESYDEKILELECNNLLALMMWDKKHSLRVLEEDLLKVILHLHGASKIEVIPFIVDMLIGNQIPYSIRSEINLKAALLRTASLSSMARLEMIHGLKTVLRADPNAFFAKFKELFDLERLPQKYKEDEKRKKEEEGSAADYTIILRHGQGKKFLFLFAFKVLNFLL